MKDNFLKLCRLWDGVASIPIEKPEQRRRAKERILLLKGNKQVVRCFRDTGGYLLICHRVKRLDDF